MHLEKLQAKVEAKAKTYDDFQRLKFIVLEKAKQKKSVVKNFKNIEKLTQKQAYDDQESQGSSTQEPVADDDFDLIYGLENEHTKETKDKIRQSKLKKGRGLLMSFYEFNQELRIPRLIRAMKMGFRVALVSDAGTPTISDPGYKFIAQA